MNLSHMKVAPEVSMSVMKMAIDTPEVQVTDLLQMLDVDTKMME